jgi:hypothetical protein
MDLLHIFMRRSNLLKRRGRNVGCAVPRISGAARPRQGRVHSAESARGVDALLPDFGWMT